MQEAYAVLPAGNCYGYSVVKFEHTILSDSCSHFRFEGFGETPSAEFFSRIRPVEKGFPAFACGAECSISAHQFDVIIIVISEITK
jgi:hypothetical protein